MLSIKPAKRIGDRRGSEKSNFENQDSDAILTHTFGAITIKVTNDSYREVMVKYRFQTSVMFQTTQIFNT